MSVATHLKLNASKIHSYIHTVKCLIHSVIFIEIIMMLPIREGMNVKSFLGINIYIMYMYISINNENIRLYRDPYTAS